MNKVIVGFLSIFYLSIGSQASNFSWEPGGKSFTCAINLASKFDGQRVDRANGFLGKSAAMIGESVMAVSRTAVDVIVFPKDHPWQTIGGIAGAVLTAAAIEGNGNPVRGFKEWAGSYDESEPATITQDDLKSDPDIVQKTDGNGNTFYYKYDPANGNPKMYSETTGDNNKTIVEPIDIVTGKQIGRAHV